MDDHTSSTLDAASLSHLSSQLQSLGFITRPLDVASLFSTTTSPVSTSTSSSTSSSSILAHQALLQQQSRAREQVLRCLWGLLTARNDAADGLEAVAARERVVGYELERTQGMLKKERHAREASEKERENEKAKAKVAATDLATEQARHRHAKEELAKARSALQFVKAQAQLDQKRRDAELSATMARLQRLTADPTQSKFVVVNAQLASSTSPIPGQGSTARTVSHRSTPLLRSDNEASVEVVFLQTALDESDQERARVAEENEKLRELVGEVGEWTELMLSIEAVNGKEAQEIGEGLEADYSLSVPSPHLAVSVAELAGPVHNKLYQIRCGVQALVDGLEARVEAARQEIDAELEQEREELQEVKRAKEEIESELAVARETMTQSNKLVQDFASRQFLSGVEATPAAKDDDDDITHFVATRPSPASEQVVSPPVGSRPSVGTADKLEAQRAQDVAAFLEDLGLDSPVPVAPPLKSVALKATKVPRAPLVVTQSSSTTTTTTTSSTATNGSERLQKVLERTREEMTLNRQRQKENK